MTQHDDCALCTDRIRHYHRGDPFESVVDWLARTQGLAELEARHDRAMDQGDDE